MEIKCSRDALLDISESRKNQYIAELLGDTTVILLSYSILSYRISLYCISNVLNSHSIRYGKEMEQQAPELRCST